MTELQQLERQLAESAARAEIFSNCPPRQDVTEDTNARWYDTAGVPADEADLVLPAVRYLELRQLLIRHPTQPALVQLSAAPPAASEAEAQTTLAGRVFGPRSVPSTGNGRG